MQRNTVFTLAIGILAGFGFASITAIEGGMTKIVGALNASLIENFMAGLISLVVLVVLFSTGRLSMSYFRPVLLPAGVGGGLVILSVAAIAWTISRLGVAVGNMAMLFGQLVLATFIDTLGIGGYERIPLSLPRIAGLFLMLGGMFLVLPKQ